MAAVLPVMNVSFSMLKVLKVSLGREKNRRREGNSFVMQGRFPEEFYRGITEAFPSLCLFSARGWQAAESYHNAGDKTLRREVTSMVEETNLLDLNEGIGSGGMSPFTKVPFPTLQHSNFSF